MQINQHLFLVPYLVIPVKSMHHFEWEDTPFIAYLLNYKSECMHPYFPFSVLPRNTSTCFLKCFHINWYHLL